MVALIIDLTKPSSAETLVAGGEESMLGRSTCDEWPPLGPPVSPALQLRGPGLVEWTASLPPTERERERLSG